MQSEICESRPIMGPPDGSGPPCPFCGEEWYLDLLEAWAEDRAWLFDTCCEAYHGALLDELQDAGEMPSHRRVRYLTPLKELFAGYGLPFRTCAQADGRFLWDPGLEIGEVSFREVRDFVDLHHRHNRPPVGWRWGHGIYSGGTLVGVAVVGRPVARMLGHLPWVEVTRLCVRADLGELTWNACSALYSAAAHKAKKEGYERAITYTLAPPFESGHSLRQAGWIPVYRSKGGAWGRKSRERAIVAPTVPKIRWERVVRKGVKGLPELPFLRDGESAVQIDAFAGAL